MTSLLQDVRHGARLLRLSPSTTAIAVLSLALTVGVSAIVFTALHAVILAPMPYAHPEELVVLSSLGREANWVSWSDMQDVARRNRTLQSVGSYRYALLNLAGDGARPPEALYGLYVSPSLFPTLGVAPMIGRNILPEEARPGRSHEIILSYGLWRRRFAADRDILGRAIHANGYDYRVIGVMPPGFDFPLRLATTVRTNSPYMEFWAPWDLTPEKDAGRSPSFAAVARLRPGVTLTEARQDLASIAAELAREYPRSNGDRPIEAFPFEARTLGDSRPALLVLMAAAALFMVIGCSNVANLLLLRSLARRREIAVRLALGAARSRIVRQLVTESCLLAITGGLLAWVLTALAWKILPAVVPQNIPRLITAAVDWRVFVFALAVAVANGLVFGILPALQAASTEPAGALREAGGRGAVGPARNRLRFAIVAAEVALTVVLVTIGVQLGAAFVRLMRGNLGFDPHHVLASIIVPQGPAYNGKPEQWASFFGALRDRARELPGVESAAVLNALPFSGENNGAYIGTADSPYPAHTPENIAECDPVSAGYFETLGIHLLRGRLFTRADENSNARYAVIDEIAARRFFPGRDPLGQRLCINCAPGKPPDWQQVIGVVNPTRHYSLEGPPDPAIYLAGGVLSRVDFLVLRVRGRATDVAAPLRRLVAGIDPGVPIYLSAEMTSFIGDSVADRRFIMAVLAVTAVLALLLAMAGVYGVLSWATSRRTQEIGVRVALGATRASIGRLVLREGMIMAGSGLACGIVTALVAIRLLRGVLAGLRSADAGSILLASAVVILTAALACLVPARRATRVDPVVALRHE